MEIRVVGNHILSGEFVDNNRVNGAESVNRNLGVVVTRYGSSRSVERLSLIRISEPTRLGMNSYAVICLKKK